MIEELEECGYRRSFYTPECGGMVLWYCNKFTKQINVYEDCEECKKEV